MGILDNTFVKMLLQGPPQVMRDMQREQQALQAQGILQSALTGTQPDASGMGPVRPMDYMGTAAQLAALPQYQPMVAQMLAQGQAGEQAMGRQLQGQQFSMENVPLAQQQQLALQGRQLDTQSSQWERQFAQSLAQQQEAIRQFNVRQAWDREQWGGLSAAQQANLGIQQNQLGISAGQLGVSQGELALRQAQFARASLMGNAPELPASTVASAVTTVNQLEPAMGSITTMLGILGNKQGTLGGLSSEQKGQWQAATIPVQGAMAALAQTGVLNEADMKRFAPLLADPGRSPLGWSDDKARAALTELQSLMRKNYGKASSVLQGQNPYAVKPTLPKGFQVEQR